MRRNLSTSALGQWTKPLATRTATPVNMELDALFQATEVDEVWGVGRRIGKQLNDAGVHTVLDLVRLSPSMVRDRWSVVLERTVRELQGEPCISLEDSPEPKQQIACTCSFGQAITDLASLIEAISEFASRAAEKLRNQNSHAGQLQVFAHTSPFRPGPRFSNSVIVPLRRPTSDTMLLVQAAVAGVKSIYKPGFQLAKAGVMLLDLAATIVKQHELEFDEAGAKDRHRLMLAVDCINDRFGRGSIHVGSAVGAGHARTWSMRQERLTPQYTTKWVDMPVARA